MHTVQVSSPRIPVFNGEVADDKTIGQLGK